MNTEKVELTRKGKTLEILDERASLFHYQASGYALQAINAGSEEQEKNYKEMARIALAQYDAMKQAYAIVAKNM